MTYAEFRADMAAFEARMAAHKIIMNKAPRNAIGLPDETARTSPEYQAARAGVNMEFENMRRNNIINAALFRKEIRADIDATRLAKLKGSIG